ncbi:alpha/beta hydrolase [Corynebacterium sp.]|uniref:alpha/beta hydrolase n=1 Tax=Corynebacterium sp. TaxID=1720 RepID=UPI0026DB4032|nr:alpha/beta hydrolase [Corynebacterium sp.]MDO5032479.1 alpha/beta hydrolase [Corynebacterium sp.]
MTAPSLQWTTDILGPDFQSAPLPLGPDPDGEGDIYATLVHYAPDAQDTSQRPALVWVHGMTDYFFQAHVAEFFHQHGYDFYAVDLRKCGRSHRSGQSWHYISNLHHYGTDLNAALDALPNPQVGFIGHSTAGPILALWVDSLRRTDPARYQRISCVIFNSPWLGMMGMSHGFYSVAKHAIFALGGLFPNAPLPGGNLTAYGESIHADHHGEWDFDLALKPLGGHPKKMGWIRAVFKAFDEIHSGAVTMGVPLLTLTSDHSELGKPYSEATNTADAIVDTAHSQRWAKELSAHYTLHVIPQARHDVFLSLTAPREEACGACLDWLDKVMPAATT